MMTYNTPDTDFKRSGAFWSGILFFACLLLPACGGPDAPIDADIRQQIDSITGVQTRLAQKEIDSLCKLGRVTLLPHLVDSIKAVRKREVEEQLRTIPRQ